MLAAGQVQAQTTQGTVALTGILGYYRNTGSADKEELGVRYDALDQDYTIAVAAGFFLQDNLELGASVFMNNSENKSLTPYYSHITDQRSDRQEKTLRIYARKYKFLTEKLAAHATLSGGWNNIAFDVVNTATYLNAPNFTTTYTIADHYNTYSAALSPGLSYFVSDKIAIGLNLGALAYSRYKVDEKFKNIDTRFPDNTYETKYTSHILELDFSSMNFNLGLSYFFHK